MAMTKAGWRALCDQLYLMIKRQAKCTCVYRRTPAGLPLFDKKGERIKERECAYCPAVKAYEEANGKRTPVELGASPRRSQSKESDA